MEFLLFGLLWLLKHGLPALFFGLLAVFVVWLLGSWVRHSCFRHDWRGGLVLGDATTLTYTCAKCGTQRTVSRV